MTCNILFLFKFLMTFRVSFVFGEGIGLKNGSLMVDDFIIKLFIFSLKSQCHYFNQKQTLKK